MADTSNVWHVHHKDDASAVVDLQDIEEMEIIDKEDPPFYSHAEPQKKEQKGSSGGFFEDVRQRIGQSVTEKMWQTGSSEAKKAWNIYGNIDVLRPYFDVEPHEVRSRLLSSLIPQKPTSEPQRVPKELYGPTMVIFSLIALLLFQMKTAEHTVEEGTLMGTAFGVCFMYWFGVSGFIWFLSYVCNTQITIVQILNMLGYGMFGHCLVLFVGTLLHTSHDHLLFYLLWAVIGGLSTLRMVCILLSRTHGQTQRLIMCGFVAAVHLLFLLYLHFAYHRIVEEISEVFDQHPVVPKPMQIETVQVVQQAEQQVVQQAEQQVVQQAEQQVVQQAVQQAEQVEVVKKDVER